MTARGLLWLPASSTTVLDCLDSRDRSEMQPQRVYLVAGDLASAWNHRWMASRAVKLPIVSRTKASDVVQ
eukprot:5935468-Prymnesium_polylepis.2